SAGLSILGGSFAAAESRRSITEIGDPGRPTLDRLQSSGSPAGQDGSRRWRSTGANYDTPACLGYISWARTSSGSRRDQRQQDRDVYSAKNWHVVSPIRYLPDGR